jgi:hypothetical protein
MWALFLETAVTGTKKVVGFIFLFHVMMSTISYYYFIFYRK